MPKLCKHGHEKTRENTTKRGECKICCSNVSRKSYKKRIGLVTDAPVEVQEPLITSSGKIIPAPTKIENELFPERTVKPWKRFQPVPEVDIDRAVRKYTAQLKAFNAEMAAKGYVVEGGLYELGVEYKY